MNINLEKLNNELKDNLSFWMCNSINPNKNLIYGAASIDGVPDTSEPIGSMYLSRILYGVSTACAVMETDKYNQLAEISYRQLQEFINPKGGYYWAKNASNVMLHDADNENMAQAFVLYGLVAYAKIKPSLEIDLAIENQVDFIKKVLFDGANGGYIDGFDENWLLGKAPTKSLGTHLHLLEAFVSLYQYRKDEDLVPIIEDIIVIILEHFITKDSYNCIHRLTPEWKPLYNEVWAGHNTECSWILCFSAKVIKNSELVDRCNDIALKMVNQALSKAMDTKNGGVFNVLKNELPTESVKIWWPQGETVLALLNCFQITKERKYQTQALELITFISNNFIAPNGEWYTEIWNNGKPKKTLPIVHFWKSMYHTVRYYAMIHKFSD